MTDYYSVMLGAVGRLDPNTVEARRHTYDRARRAMRERLQGLEPHLPEPVIDAELEAFDQAIERVEAQQGGRGAYGARAPLMPEPQAPELAIPESRTSRPRRGILVPVMTVLAILGVVIAVGLGAIIFGPRIGRDKQPAQAETSTGVSYVYLKQPVYYRTTQPVGTILVDKAQHFIYIVLPNVVALRYGIGVGPECATAAGLYSISRKEEWPGRSNSSFGQLRNMFGSSEPADNPLGPRALYFGTDYRLHGTNAPAGIGGTMSAGCIALINDSITEFYDKAPVETRVVVMD